MGSPVKFGVRQFQYRPISPKVQEDIPERNLRISFLTLKAASELETELIIANRLGYLDEPSFRALIHELDRIGRLITGLVRHLGSRPLAT